MKIRFDQILFYIIAICLAILATVSAFCGQTVVGLLFLACAVIAAKVGDKCD